MFWDQIPFTDEYVFHCAAFKHVRLGGLNEVGYYSNNAEKVSVLLQQLACSTAKFILVSTDKATNFSVMGQSKRQAEGYVRDRKQTSLRLVNVAFSHGSVLDLWSKSKVHKICNPKVSRYWMQAQDAVYALCLVALSPPGTYTVHNVPEFTMKQMKIAWEKEYGPKRWKEFEMVGEVNKEYLIAESEKMKPQNDILARIEPC
jgi:FlaA1/EpsC-like NDP-sugar epimerase